MQPFLPSTILSLDGRHTSTAMSLCYSLPRALHEQRPLKQLGFIMYSKHGAVQYSSTSSAQLCSQLFSLCFFQLRNASHRFWAQDIPAPVTTDLQGRENRLETSSHLLLCHSTLHKGKSSLNYKVLHISSTALHFGAAKRKV